MESGEAAPIRTLPLHPPLRVPGVERWKGRGGGVTIANDGATVLDKMVVEHQVRT